MHTEKIRNNKETMYSPRNFQRGKKKPKKSVKYVFFVRTRTLFLLYEQILSVSIVQSCSDESQTEYISSSKVL